VEGRSYMFRVRAVNQSGMSRPSRKTRHIRASRRNTDTSVVVSWEASKEAKELVGYYIEGSIVDSNVWEPCNNKPVNATRFICHGLRTGEKYIFRVRAVNAAGLSQFSPESEPVEVKAAIASPAPPYGITVLECVCDSMVLAWKQPSFIGGADITGYFVDYREVIDGVAGKWHEANIRVCDLKENKKYQFQVRAANMAGVGIPSLASDTFLCEEWTIAVPGPPHDLQIREVRSDSLVLLWKPPVYQGRDPVNGFYIDIKEAGAPEEAWRGVNTKATEKAFIKVANLKAGETFVFRVRAQNKAGVGQTSAVTEPVVALTKAGTKDIVVDVDDNGNISMNFECCDMTPDSKFVWSKNYEDITDPSRLTLETKGNKSKAVFNTPEEEDVGIYSCLVTHTDGASSSYTLSEEELKRLLEVSHDHKFPIIPLKSALAVELLEKGKVRFWLQADKMSANGKVDYIFNDNALSPGDMNFDKNTGVIEMIMDSLTPADEGTFTFQLQDGKATNQSSLVLIGDVIAVDLLLHYTISFPYFITAMFAAGPHFIEYLGYEVTQECCVILKCKVRTLKGFPAALFYRQTASVDLNMSIGCDAFQVGNMKKETSALWYKDGHQIKADESLANSSTPLKITSTDEGIRLYTFVNYYNDLLQVTWHYKDSAVSFSDRIKSGVVGEQLWLQITEPTEKDTGKYAIEFNDGKGGLRRTVELSGQAFDDAFLTLFLSGRARVAGGLPDVVTIQEGKALNLTCNISGDPLPEVTWLKNDREITSDDHCILKFASGKFASFTITAVNSSDSGKYSILVKNKYGTESGDFTVSAFIADEADQPPAWRRPLSLL
uniref:Myomesin 1 n=1 Tax=Cyclopterus lumpus TaxID=8103 RepID=A0A8C3AEE7_CYCLU